MPQPPLSAVTLLAAALAMAALVGCTTTIRGEATTAASAENPMPNSPFARAAPGDCLDWPDAMPDQARRVECAAAHRFEVAGIVDLSADFGPGAEPPTPADIARLGQDRCPAVVRTYLGSKFDPNSRFGTSLLWSGEQSWRAGERRALCGLQLAGPNGRQLQVTARVADQDQSRIWPAGTCIGIDPTTAAPTDVAVDCRDPHAMEVTGSVDVGALFPAGTPPEAAQDPLIRDACVQLTDAYLSPVELRATTLTVVYSPVGSESWAAGSRQVSCDIGALVDGRWATLLNGAKGPLLINGRPPAP